MNLQFLARYHNLYSAATPKYLNNLKVCHPHYVKSITQYIYFVYTYIYMQSKTQQFVI
jgi:hypothetical protein